MSKCGIIPLKLSFDNDKQGTMVNTISATVIVTKITKITMLKSKDEKRNFIL